MRSGYDLPPLMFTRAEIAAVLPEALRDSAVGTLGLWFRVKVWTLIVWCDLRNDFRMFRIDRIAAARAIGPFRPERGRSLAAFFESEPHHGHSHREPRASSLSKYPRGPGGGAPAGRAGA